MAAKVEDPQWKVLLNKYRVELRTSLVIGKVLPAIRSLLTSEEYLCIESKEGDVDRVDELIKILLTKDNSAFEAFCLALEENGYSDWACKLREKGISLFLRTGCV